MQSFLLSINALTTFVIIFNVALCLLNIINVKKYLHIFQLKDYSSFRYIKHIFKKQIYYILTNIFLLILNLLIKNEILLLISAIVLLIINFLFNYKLIETNKTPIKYTKKFIRLLILSILLIIVVSFIPKSILYINLFTIIVPILSIFLNVYDIIKNKYYINKAKEKLRLNKTKVIAITGSNGKTSVKNILEKMLSKKYKVCATPKSYNTPLGIAKFINEDLNNDCDYLILEYGARRRGDIKKLCKLFGADFGIITTVAPQHLETFKTIENVFKEKRELSKFLSSGCCVFNLDNLHTYRMFEQRENNKIGVSIYQKCDIYAEKIKIKNFLTHFNLHIYNKSYQVETCLLGRHNVLNILLATALAKKLNIEDSDIIDTIKNLQFVPHRLELIKSNIYILDDSYNCSLISAKESINVLNEISKDLKRVEKRLNKKTNLGLDNYNLIKSNSNANLEKNFKFLKNSTKNDEKIAKISEKTKNLKNFSNILNESNVNTDNQNKKFKRVICTPGIIEGGKFEYVLNLKLGKLCAKSDEVIIVGEYNKNAIYSGLKSSNYIDENIIFCKTLENAKEYFKHLSSGDILLLLNDLPDDYK